MAGQLRKDDIIEQAAIEGALKSIADATGKVVEGFAAIAAEGKKIAKEVGGVQVLKDLVTLSKQQAIASANLAKEQKNLLTIEKQVTQQTILNNKAKQSAIRVTQMETDALAKNERLKQTQIRTAKLQEQQTRKTTGGLYGLVKAIGMWGAAIFSLNKIWQFFSRDMLSMIETLNSLEFSMKTIIKTQDELAATQQFLRNTALNYGQDIITLTERYIKFRAAAMQSNLSVKETMHIFDSTAKAAAVLGLRTDEVNGVFLALEQMISKGKVTTEELRRQLGERLPGAFGIMADAMGVSIVQLDKMLKAGEVLSSEALPKFAVALEKAYGIESVKKVDTLAAAQGRLKTAWVSFIDELKASKVYISIINEMSESLNTIRVFTGKMTKLDYMLSLDNSTSKALREAVDMMNNLTDKEAIDGLEKWKKALSQSPITPALMPELFQNYIDARNKAFKEQAKFNLKPFDAEAYSESLDKLEKDTKSFGNTIDKDLQQNIIDTNTMMKSTGKTNYKEILKLEDESLKKKQAIAFTQLQQMEDLKTIRELTKDERKEYEYASSNYIALGEARINIANRLAEVDKTKGKKEKDDSLNILREQQKAELEATRKHQQELISQGNFTDEELLRQKYDNSKELILQESAGLDEQLKIVEKGSLEEAKILSDKAKLQADLAKDLTEFLIDEEERRQKELEKIRKQESDDFIADVYEEADTARIARAEQARIEMQEAKGNAKHKKAIQIKSAIDMLAIEYRAQQQILDSNKTTEEEKAKAAEMQLKLKEQLENEVLEGTVEATKLQREEYRKTVDAVAQLGSQMFDVIGGFYDNQMTKIDELHDYEIKAAGDSVEKRIMAERKYDREKAKLMRKQAISQKAQSAFNIIINTAEAIMATLGETGFFGTPLAVLIGALGAAQLATVLAAPIPAYAKGTKNAPATFIAGEAGQEAILKPSGEVVLTPNSPTMFSDKSFVGSTILPADQTQKMLANYAIKQSYDMIDMSESNKHLRAIASNTKNKKEVFVNAMGKTVIKRGYITSTIV